MALDRVIDPTSGGASGTVAYAWTISSGNRGQAYRNNLCIFDVADGRITGYRAYVDELDPDATANGAVEPTNS